MNSLGMSRFVLDLERVTMFEESSTRLDSIISSSIASLQEKFAKERSDSDAAWAGLVLCALDLLDKSHPHYGALASGLQRAVNEALSSQHIVDGNSDTPEVRPQVTDGVER